MGVSVHQVDADIHCSGWLCCFLKIVKTNFNSFSNSPTKFNSLRESVPQNKLLLEKIGGHKMDFLEVKIQLPKSSKARQ